MRLARRLRCGRAPMNKFLPLVLIASCASPSEPDLPLGDVSRDDLKSDAPWGAALTCKAVPVLPRLIAPEIPISLNGLTLRLSDEASGFDEVFPIGVGTIDPDEGSATYGESRSYWPVLAHDT